MAVTDGATWSADNFLKTVYLPYLQTQYVRDNVFLSMCRKGSEYVTTQPTGGAQANWAIRTGRNGNGTAYSREGAYPRASRQSGAQPYSSLKALAKQIQITTLLMDAAKNNKQAFRDSFTDEMDSSIEDFKEDISRQLHLDSTGIIAVAGSLTNNTTNAITVTLDSTATHRWNPIVKPFRDYTQPRVQVYTTGGTLQGTGYVSSVDQTNGAIVITFDSAATPTLNVGDYIYYESAKGTELTGYESIAGTGNLFNVTVSSYPSWQAALVRTTFEDPTEANMDRLRAAGMANGGKYKCALTTWGVQAKYSSLLFDRKRWDNNVEMKGGTPGTEDTAAGDNGEFKFNGPYFHGVGPLIADNWVPQGTNANTGWVELPDFRYLFFQQTGEPKWDDADGRVLKPNVGYGLYTAAYYWFAEFCANRRNTHVLHKNMNATSLS